MVPARSSEAGKVVLVTGANAGLGYALSAALARGGAHVVMACRSSQRASRALCRLRAEVPGAILSIVEVDLSDLASIRHLGATFSEQVGELDVLVHNAGVFGLPINRNGVGQEMHFATNYLGPFALTGALLPYFREEPGARIVTVGSLAHRFGRPSVEDPYEDAGRYSAWSAYGRSKVSLLAYTFELDRRLRASGRSIIALGAHPGMAATDIANGHAVASPRSALGRWLVSRLEGWVPTAAEAARPVLHAVCAPGVRGAEYYGPGGFLEIAGAPAPAYVSPRALDTAFAQRLWAASEKLTGIRYLS